MSEKLLAPLKPLIITQQNYLENILIPNDEVPSKVATSVYRSVQHPLSNCPYMSWSQVLPPNRGTYGLSWLIDPNPGKEVIQFLTGQLNYRIEYTITNPSRSRYVDGRMRLILVVPNSNVGYEPWDVNGKRIEFEIPIPNRTTRGCFVLPGMYSQFIIESPSRLLEMELRVTGFIPEVDKYEAGQFCLNTDNNRIVAYSNTVRRFGILHREFNPLLSDYADRVIEEFTSNPAQSCYTTANPLSKRLNRSTHQDPTVQSKIANRKTVLQQQNSATLRFEADSTDMITRVNNCASGYLNIPLKNITQGAPSIVSTVSGNGDNTQFLLFLGETYNIHIRRAGEPSPLRAVTPTFNQLVERDLVPVDAQYISGPTLDCDPDQVVWLFYSVANKQPAIIQLKPNLPPFANQEGISIVKLDIRYEGGNEEGLAILEFPEPSAGSYDLVVAPTRGDITYATRINGLVWTWKYSIPTGETLFHTYYGVDQMHMDLQLTTV